MARPDLSYANMPQRLKNMRGLILLADYAAHAPVSEVPCPACKGVGRPPAERDDLFSRCPLCLGWGVVPLGVAHWYAAKGQSQGTRTYPEHIRWGLLAEARYHTAIPLQPNKRSRRELVRRA